MKEEFDKAKDQQAFSYGNESDSNWPQINSFVVGADWAYEWLKDINTTLNGYINARDKQIKALEQKLTVAVECLEELAELELSENDLASKTLARIKGDASE